MNWYPKSAQNRIGTTFAPPIACEDQFNKYVFVDSGKIVGFLGKEPPLLQSREEFKIEEAREIWKKLIAQGWRRTDLFD
mgnify:CR=1 FL=1